MAGIRISPQKSSTISQVFNTLEYPETSISPITMRVNDDDIVTMYPNYNKDLKKWFTKNSGIDVDRKSRIVYLKKFAEQLQARLSEPLNDDISESSSKLIIDSIVNHLTIICLSQNIYPNNWKPSGAAVLILSESTPLETIGTSIGTALFAGYNVLIQAPNKRKMFCNILNDTAILAGFPKNTITVFSAGSFPIEVFANNEDIAILSIYDDIERNEYNTSSSMNQQVLSNSSTNEILNVIFESSDLDSTAFDVLSTFENKERPSVRTILVQDMVLQKFVAKLKRLLMQEKSVLPKPKINYPEKDVKAYNAIIKEATTCEIEIIGTLSSTIPNDLKPIVLIDGENLLKKIQNSNVPVLNISSFRSVKEAITIANSYKNRHYVSIWTENISLVNEVIDKLQFRNIYVNSSSLGKNQLVNFNELYDFIIPSAAQISVEYLNKEKNTNASKINEILDNARKAQTVFSQLSKLERAKILRNAFRSELLENYIFESSGDIFENYQESNATLRRVPLGPIVIQIAGDEFEEKIINAALYEGNALILLNTAETISQNVTNLIKLLPKFLVTILSFTESNSKLLLIHPDVNTALMFSLNEQMPLRTLRKIKRLIPSATARHLQAVVTTLKNVWINKGYSII